MNKRLISRLLIAIIATGAFAMMTACSSDEGPAIDPIDDTQAGEPTRLVLSSNESDMLEALSDFAFDTNTAISKQVSSQTGKPANYAYSPINLEMALSLLANGIEEPQRGTLVKILGLGNLADLNTLNTKLYNYLYDKTNGVQVSLANSVWYDDAYSMSYGYTDNMGAMYGLECFKKDFTSAKTTDEINSWLAQKTHNMISDVVKKDVLDNTDMLLFNAMYFFGRWDAKFDVSNTDRQRFNGVEKSQKVQTMHKKSLMAHSSANGWQMISEPFKTLTYECLFILPPSTDALQDFDADVLQSLMNDLRTREVTLSLPKFDIESHLNTADIIAKMGLPLKDLRLTPMGFPDSYYQNLSNMGQAAKIQVDEEGARLAAVTNYLQYSTGGTTEYEKVKIDFNRPFLFVVRHSNTGFILMMGQVCDI